MTAAEHPVAIVTGAGSGIGRAVSVALAERGWRVALAARTQESLEETSDLVDEAYQQSAKHVELPAALVVPTDVADPRAVRAMIERVREAFGRIDALVNNAGLAPLAPIEKTDPEMLSDVFAVNTLGTGYAIHEVWPIFKRQRRGVIVNVSSMASRDPFPGFFAYAAAKATVNLFAYSCAKEGAEYGIRAFAVAPGAVETPMLRALFDERTVPPDAAASPEDVADVIVGCILGERDDANGSTIFLGGD
ncbi:MAG: SDR family oxidoreductase [Planctomycetota bacterium]|nr:SDR family oxidoreductase [Planctomycetota bacterium]